MTSCLFTSFGLNYDGLSLGLFRGGLNGGLSTGSGNGLSLGLDGELGVSEYLEGNVTTVNVVNDVIGDQVDVVDLFIVELGVLVDTIEFVGLVDYTRLVLELVSNENVLAEVGGKTRSLIDFDAEVNLLADELVGLITLHVVLGFVSFSVAGLVLDRELATLTLLTLTGENLGIKVVLEHVSQVLQGKVRDTNAEGLWGVPEGVFLGLECGKRTIIEELREQVSHHCETALEFSLLPLVVVTFLGVVNLDDDVGLAV